MKEINKTIEEAKKEYTDYLSEMQVLGKFEDHALDMYLSLKDIAGGSYSPEVIIQIAEDVLYLVEK